MIFFLTQMKLYAVCVGGGGGVRGHNFFFCSGYMFVHGLCLSAIVQCSEIPCCGTSQWIVMPFWKGLLQHH